MARTLPTHGSKVTIHTASCHGFDGAQPYELTSIKSRSRLNSNCRHVSHSKNPRSEVRGFSVQPPLSRGRGLCGDCTLDYLLLGAVPPPSRADVPCWPPTVPLPEGPATPWPVVVTTALLDEVDIRSDNV